MLACIAFLSVARDLFMANLYVASLLLGAWWLQGLALSFVPAFFTATVNGWVALWSSFALAGLIAFDARNPRDLNSRVTPATPIPPADGGACGGCGACDGGGAASFLSGSAATAAVLATPPNAHSTTSGCYGYSSSPGESFADASSTLYESACA